MDNKKKINIKLILIIISIIVIVTIIFFLIKFKVNSKNNIIFEEEIIKIVDANNNDNVEVKYYSDSDKLVKINIVYKNGTIYIESNNKIETVNEDSAFEIIDAHYKKINKSVYEKYNFNSEEIPNKKYASL